MNHVTVVYIIELLFFIVNEDFNVITDNIQMQQIMFTSCDRTKDLTLDITNDLFFENNENIVITLINVTLTRTMENGSDVVLNLSEEERGRLIFSKTETTVTILDDDGKLSLVRCYILQYLMY